MADEEIKEETKEPPHENPGAGWGRRSSTARSRSAGTVDAASFTIPKVVPSPQVSFARATALLRRGAPGDGATAEALLVPILDSSADASLKGRACYALAYRHETANDDAAGDAWLRRAATYGDAQAIDLLDDRRRGLRFKRVLDLFVVCLLTCAGFAVWTLRDLVEVVVHKDLWTDEVSGSDARTVPAYAWREDVFSAAQRRALVLKGEGLLQATGDANPLSEQGFGGTRGVVLHFTRHAFEDAYAFKHLAYAWLYDDVLRELLDDRCDAFVFNILVVPPGRDANRTVGVGSHVDQTLMQPTTQREQTAYSVSVAYLQVPDKLDGGELVVGGLNHAPREGHVLTFRGDQSHRVKAFCLGKGDCSLSHKPDSKRISFVLEQYRVAPEKLKRTPAFIIAPTELEQSLLPLLASLRPLGPRLQDAYLWLRRRWLSGWHV